MLEQEEEPDTAIILSVMKACGGIRVLEWARFLYDYVIRKKLDLDTRVGNTLVDMYARCGSLVEAEGIFNRILSLNDVSWNAMIAGYEQHGDFKQAVQWFENMQSGGVKPTSQTFVSVLAACASEGKIREGRRYFDCMFTNYGLLPVIEHFNCMIELLGRAGHLQDAQGLLNTAPILPNVRGWMSLLTSCWLFSNIDIGKRAFDEVVKLDPESSSGHILMLNIYADAQMWEDVFSLQRLLRSEEKVRKPGQASLEVGGKLYEFVVGDHKPFQGQNMLQKMKDLCTLLKVAGYVPHSEIIFESTLPKFHEKLE